MKFEVLVQKLNERAEAQKRVSKYDRTSLEIICNFINYVNSLDEDTLRVFDRDFDDIVIPTELKDLVLPKSVRLIPGDRRTEDILLRPEINSKPCASYAEYMNAVDQFRGYFKKDSKSDMVTLSSLRVDVSLVEVLDRICSDDKAKVTNQGVYPITVKSVSQLLTTRFLSDSIDDVIQDWLVAVKF
jgi:hypothetical protein